MGGIAKLFYRFVYWPMRRLFGYLDPEILLDEMATVYSRLPDIFGDKRWAE